MGLDPMRGSSSATDALNSSGFMFASGPSHQIRSLTPRWTEYTVGKQKAKLLSFPGGRRSKARTAIVAGILVARHLKTADDLFDSKPSPRTESMVAAAVQWAAADHAEDRQCVLGLRSHYRKSGLTMQDRLNRMNRLFRESYSPEGPEETVDNHQLRTAGGHLRRRAHHYSED